MRLRRIALSAAALAGPSLARAGDGGGADGGCGRFNHGAVPSGGGGNATTTATPAGPPTGGSYHAALSVCGACLQDGLCAFDAPSLACVERPSDGYDGDGAAALITAALVTDPADCPPLPSCADRASCPSCSSAAGCAWCGYGEDGEEGNEGGRCVPASSTPPAAGCPRGALSADDCPLISAPASYVEGRLVVRGSSDGNNKNRGGSLSVLGGDGTRRLLSVDERDGFAVESSGRVVLAAGDGTRDKADGRSGSYRDQDGGQVVIGAGSGAGLLGGRGGESFL